MSAGTSMSCHHSGHATGGQLTRGAPDLVFAMICKIFHPNSTVHQIAVDLGHEIGRTEDELQPETVGCNSSQVITMSREHTNRQYEQSEGKSDTSDLRNGMR